MIVNKTPFEQLRLEAAAYQDWEVRGDLGYHIFIKYLEVRGWTMEEYEQALLDYIDKNWEERNN
jgi:hypothetical protein